MKIVQSLHVNTYNLHTYLNIYIVIQTIIFTVQMSKYFVIYLVLSPTVKLLFSFSKFISCWAESMWVYFF